MAQVEMWWKKMVILNWTFLLLLGNGLLVNKNEAQGHPHPGQDQQSFTPTDYSLNLHGQKTKFPTLANDGGTETTVLPDLSIYDDAWNLLLKNSGEITLLKDSVDVKMSIRTACLAPYPVTLGHEPNENYLVTEAQEDGQTPKLHYKDFYNVSTYVFYLRTKFIFAAVVNDTVFSCQSVAEPHLQHNVQVTFPKGNPNEILVTLQNSTDEGTEFIDDGSSGDDDCDAYFYWEPSTNGVLPLGYNFGCQFKDGRPGVMKLVECHHQLKCTNYLLRRGRRKRGCWRHFSNNSETGCPSCDRLTGTKYRAFVATCTSTTGGGDNLVDTPGESEVGALAFYGVQQGVDDTRPEIYFEEADVNESEMIVLLGVNQTEPYQLNSTVVIQCRASGYYASATLQIALELEGEPDLVLLSQETEYSIVWNYDVGGWIQTPRSIVLNKPNIIGIHCFGAILNSVQWLHTSRPIRIQSGTDEEETTTSTSSKQTDVLTIALSCSIMIGVLVLALVAIFLRRRGRSLYADRDLNKEEISNFLHGSSTTTISNSSSQVLKQKNTNRNLNSLADEKGETPVYCLPYNKTFETAEQNIIFDPSNVLGSGEFGVVMKGVVLTEDGEEEIVAVKTVHGDVRHFLAFLSEIKILAHLHTHPNIVRLVAACTSSIRKRKAWAALEYCPNGNLKKFLQKNGDQFLNLFSTNNDPIYVQTSTDYKNFEESGVDQLQVQACLTSLDLLNFSLGIAHGLCYLSSKQVIHGDLAARNILLSDKMEPKISDFGLSSLLLSNSNYARKQGDKLPWKWMSLEAMKDGKFSIQSDVWSFGVVLWEIWSLGAEPYQGLFFGVEFLKYLTQGHRLKLPPFANDQLYDVMMDCWKAERSERVEISKVYDRIVEISSVFESR